MWASIVCIKTLAQLLPWFEVLESNLSVHWFPILLPPFFFSVLWPFKGRKAGLLMERMFIWAVTFQSPLLIDALVVTSNSLGIPCIWGSLCGFSKLALPSKPVKRGAGTQNVKHVRIPCAQQWVSTIIPEPREKLPLAIPLCLWNVCNYTLYSLHFTELLWGQRRKWFWRHIENYRALYKWQFLSLSNTLEKCFCPSFSICCNSSLSRENEASLLAVSI